MKATKYTNLLKAQKAGVAIPPLCYLPPETLAQEGFRKTVRSFCKQNKSDTYIVRSAVLAEDTNEKSYAGYFKSSNAVSENLLIETIEEVYKENVQRSNSLEKPAEVGLILMPFIRGTYGGVLFYPWLYFHNHALLEYASSPQDAVAGSDITSGLLSLSSKLPSSPKIETLPETLETQLTAAVSKLRKVFNFKLDIEWVFDGEKFYILQVRPVTIAPLALSTKKVPETTSCVYTELSHAFGKLSPLSYSLFTHLFTHAQDYWKTMRIIGDTEFLFRAQTGNVLVDTQAYEHYYKSDSWYSAFVRGFQSKSFENELEKAFKKFHIQDTFSLSQTQVAFNNWQSAATMERVLHKTPSSIAYPFEYELTQSITIAQYPEHTLAAKWKRAFLASTLPLRDQVAKDPSLVWCNDITHITPVKDTTQYATELFESLVTYYMNQTDEHESHVCGERISGEVLRIDEPARWGEPLPKEKVVVVPYIPQNWIGELPHVKGIATLSLSALSHVAITLREHNIPTLRMSEETYTNIHTGDTLRL